MSSGPGPVCHTSHRGAPQSGWASSTFQAPGPPAGGRLGRSGRESVPCPRMDSTRLGMLRSVPASTQSDAPYPWPSGSQDVDRRRSKTQGSVTLIPRFPPWCSFCHAWPRRLENSDCTELDSGTVGRELSDRGPVAFLACLGLAAGLALLVYCCPPDPKVLPGTRRVLGFSPIIVDRHVSRFLLAFLTDDLGGL
ncbi:caspase recruitment domain-containing protein 19 isoform X5 [Lynx rufus]|uniref:caspase recruitment domain-containing protein 19 isoform X5 n=1 Tax=Lynx rufus TaxID=61384 RepID=UPI001F122E66|nr:caspase recruitment domain-containing protein 19 isoform X5 [Lynx rufus]